MIAKVISEAEESTVIGISHLLYISVSDRLGLVVCPVALHEDA